MPDYPYTHAHSHASWSNGHPKQVALLHGAGYVGGELIRLLTMHPGVEVAAVTSRTFAGEPVWKAHTHLRGQTDLVFAAPEALHEAETLHACDALIVAAEHGQSAPTIIEALEAGYEGAIVDLSADFRFGDPALYEEWFGYTHPAPDLLDAFAYGIVEHAYANGGMPYGGARYVANPGCFATGLILALAPLAAHLSPMHASVTALTGASGSGASPSAGTHFPARDGNVRAYKVLAHRHLPEVTQALGSHVQVAFTPVSGPWTRGIWGTAHIALPEGATDDADTVTHWFEGMYADAEGVRLWPGALPELKPVVGTPFCDLGWTVKGHNLVVGFALDNLLKGAASQAVQNLNLLMGWPSAAGLLPMKPAAIPAS